MRVLVIAFALLSIWVVPLHAQPVPGSAEGGWASLKLGAGYIRTTDRLNGDGGNRRAGSLDHSAGSAEKLIPLILFDLGYNLPSSNTKVYLKTPFGESGPPGLATGLEQVVEGAGSFDLSLWVNPFGKVWKDPYVTGASRETASKLNSGLNLDWDRVMSTPLELGYRFGRVSVSDDQIGKIYGELERSGATHALEVGYGYNMPWGIRLTPTMTLERGTMDGGANSYSGYGMRLGISKFTRSLVANIFLSVARNGYDEPHPIFDKRRSDVKTGFLGILTLPNLFGVRDLSADLICGYFNRSSNISFLDAESFFAGIGLGYKLF